MNHVISSLADSLNVFFPVFRIFPHELRNEREYGQSRQGYLPPFKSESRSYIDVVCFGLCRLEGLLGGVGKLGERCIGGIESERACAVDRN
jgi:hypothetical protein